MNYSDDTHKESGIFYALFQDTIWSVIPVLYCPFKDMREVKMSYTLISYITLMSYTLIHTRAHTHIYINRMHIHLFKYKM